MRFLIVSLLSFFFVTGCKSQSFVYKKAPVERATEFNRFYELGSQQGYVHAVEYFPDEHVTDGSIDYTDFLQEAIEKNRKLIMPDFPVLINDKSLFIPSNTHIYFPKNGKLLMAPSNKGDDNKNHYNAITIKLVDNVTIYNCHIIGDRKEHNGTKGEWGMGISVLSSSNVKILGGNISDCWGDGIYLGNTRQRSSHFDNRYIPPKNITIRNVILDNNRRNGISVTTGYDIKIEKVLISNTNGTLPMSGIDIEPNSPLDIINNIEIMDLYTFNNARDGILLVLTRIPDSEKNREVNIAIRRHVDNGSYSPLRIGSGFRKADRELMGRLIVADSFWENNEVGVRYRPGYNLLPEVILTNNTFGNMPSNRKYVDDQYQNATEISTLKFN